ncbi:MAG TPA: protein-glutamate O-methyltransferase CheR [Pirellulales bacterium]|nr:protein-glutamate O-methyltransferase CheR [Pirellulales bacterium]
MTTLELTSADFDFIRNLVRDRAAIVLEQEKHYLIETRLQMLAKTDGFPTVSHLMAEVRSGKPNVHTRVVEAMTTNETSFFRDLEPFEALRKLVLPELMSRREQQRKLRFWCAASSTGQEPYSIAMLLRDHQPSLKDWQVQIQASDLANPVLDRARRAAFSQLEVNRGLPAILLCKYFLKQGTEWLLKDEIRSMVEFFQMNLIAPWPVLPAMDVIFLRNVLIYFDVATKQQILARVRKTLRPDGFLFLGGAETTMNLDDSFERVAYARSGCYRLRPGA